MAGRQEQYDEAMASAADFSRLGDWPNAVKAFHAALTEFPEDATAMVGLGTAYVELAQYESAIRALQRALKGAPTNQQAMTKMAEALEQLDRHEDAAKTYVYSGNVYAKDNQIYEAIAAWEKAVQVFPQQIQARTNLVQAYIRQQRSDLAIAQLIELAATYQDQADNQKAQQHIQAALRIDANSPEAKAAAQALADGRSVRIPLQPFNQPFADELDDDDYRSAPPRSAAAEDEWYLLGFSAEDDSSGPTNPREKTRQAAMEELANILFEDGQSYAGRLSISKPQLDAAIGQAIDLETRQRTDEAIQTYEKIISAGFNRPAAYFAIATLYLDNQQYEQAVTYLNQAKSDKNYLIGVNFALGEVYKSMGEANQALRHFVEVLKMVEFKYAHRESTRELEQLYSALIDNYISRGDERRTMKFANSLANFLSSKNWERRIAEARRRLGIDDGASVSAWIEFLEEEETEVILTTMAETADYVRQNMLMTAAEVCYWAIQRAPYYLPLHMRLAEVYMKQDRIEDSINKYLAISEVYRVRENLGQVAAIYQQVLKVAPMDVTVRTRLVDLYIDHGNVDAALEQYKVLADAYYQLAQVRTALEKYQEALRLAPRSNRPKNWQIDILYSMGDIYTQRVNWEKAVETFEQLVKLSPEDDRAWHQLVDLYFKTNEPKKAVAALDRLMNLYVKQQKQAKILKVLQDLIELHPQDLILNDRLAAFYTHLGMTKQALDQYNKLGELQLEAGLRDDAARTIETIIRLGPDDPDGYRQLLSQIRGGI